MRLIDADKLPKYTGYALSTSEVAIAVENAPTVDAVQVVRCRECKHYLNSNEKCGLIDTRLHFYETDNVWTADCFCSWGERKGGDE
jgi:hypothetical protein